MEEKWEKRFFKDVRFKNRKSKKHLYKPILNWVEQNDRDIFKQFESITNYVSHATVDTVKRKAEFQVCYPIAISGKNLSDICIIDANHNVYHIALMTNQIIYFEKQGKTIAIYGAKVPYETGNTFYSKKICGNVEV